MANRIISKRLVGISKLSRAHRYLRSLPLWAQCVCVRLIWGATLFANRVLPGYVSPNDAGKYEMVIDHDGPASYAIGGPTFTTGGDPVNALDVGMSGFESVGVDSVINAPNVAGGPFGAVVAEVKLGTVAAGIPFGASALSSLTIFYFQSPTRGTEFANATNLSSIAVRLRVMCV